MKKLVIILSILLIVLVGGFLVVDKNSKESSKTNNLDSSSDNSNREEIKSIKTFISEDLPGFTFQYNDDWDLSIKPFGEKDVEGEYDGGYFSSCGDRCMGVTLIKNDTNVQMEFNWGLDLNSRDDCSNTAKYKSIGEKWYRIYSNDSVSYTNLVEENITLREKHSIPFGTINDEWSAVSGESYKICHSGFVNFITLSSYKAEMFKPHGGGILFEYPKVTGHHDEEILDEIDDIVRSIHDADKIEYEFTDYPISLSYPKGFYISEDFTDNIDSIEIHNSRSTFMMNMNQPGFGIEGDVELTEEPILDKDGNQVVISGELIKKNKVYDKSLDETYYLFGISYPNSQELGYSILINYSFESGVVNEEDIKVFDEIVASIKFIE